MTAVRERAHLWTLSTIFWETFRGSPFRAFHLSGERTAKSSLRWLPRRRHSKFLSNFDTTSKHCSMIAIFVLCPCWTTFLVCYLSHLRMILIVYRGHWIIMSFLVLSLLVFT